MPHWDKVTLVSIAPRRSYRLPLLLFASGQVIVLALFAILIIVRQMLPLLIIVLFIAVLGTVTISVMVWTAQQPKYRVVLRGTWTARQVGPLATDKGQLEDLAISLVKTIRAQRLQGAASDTQRDTVMLAGNSVEINDKGRLENAGMEYALDEATAVRVRGEAPKGYYKLIVGVIGLFIALFIVDLAALAIIGIFDHMATGYWFPLFFYVSLGLIFSSLLYTHTTQPGIWHVDVTTAKDAMWPTCIYKSEDRYQAEKVAQMLRSYLLGNLAEGAKPSTRL